MRKWMVVLGVLILAGGGCAYYAYRSQDQAPAAAAATARTVQATQGSIETSVSGSGTVAAADPTVVRTGRQGTVEKVLVQEGDEVKAGQTLLTFEKKDNALGIRQKQLEQSKQELSLQQLKVQYWQEGDEDKQDELMLQIDSAKLSLEQLAADIADLQAEQNADGKVVAPAAGTVTAVAVEAGQEVNGSVEAVTLTDYSELTFTMSADELDVPKLKAGQQAEIVLNALPDETFEGEITDIARAGTSSNGVASYPVTIRMTRLAGVLAGMSGSVKIVTESADNAVLVPVDAVVTMAGKSYVRVPASGTDAAAGGAGAAAADGASGQGQGQGQWQGQRGERPAGSGQGQPGTGAAGQAGAAGQPAAAGQPGAAGQAGAAGEVGAAAGQSGSNRANRMALGGQLQEVEVGLISEDYAQIVSGLSAGDSVLVPLPTGTVGGSTGQSTQQGGFGAGGGFGGGAAGFGGGMPGGMGGGMGGGRN
ncbi:putative Co/Zn/Cd efflux system membrane fusion protein [Paenibacillus pasadenensis]|uniref:Putative Co/Zn/Cd efflux system membrane fusion protein n=1 Tax=Paenibacillus pasadenensis TaxID=217090 RepID=A0A2N5NDG2_9BACL|nr:efflux RND transporter periplasmic adaptor subunit [Paenibacillus pasadenensis]PLT48387.1 putative Co/Zn/Cd efflux system membrane fusion protein [Paenibacillus pasadenensis]